MPLIFQRAFRTILLEFPDFRPFEQQRNFSDAFSFFQIASCLFNQLPADERSKVKGLLVFHHRRLSRGSVSILLSLCKSAGCESVALCGGSGCITSSLDNLAFQGWEDKVVFFCGEERLNICSFVLDENARGRQAVKEAMAQVRF
jgi:hypothetical protein